MPYFCQIDYLTYLNLLKFKSNFSLTCCIIPVSIDHFWPLNVMWPLSKILLFGLYGYKFFEWQPIKVLSRCCFAQQLLLIEHLMNVPVVWLNYYFLLLLGLERYYFFCCTATWSCLWNSFFYCRRGCMYFSHQLLPSFFLFFLVFVNYLLFLASLFFVMLWFRLIEITIKLIPSWATLDVILLIVISII